MTIAQFGSITFLAGGWILFWLAMGIREREGEMPSPPSGKRLRCNTKRKTPGIDVWRAFVSLLFLHFLCRVWVRDRNRIKRSFVGSRLVAAIFMVNFSRVRS